MKKEVNNILDYFNELFKSIKSELIYDTDYQLLMAVVLSAQATDKMVNKITSKLFSKYSNLKALNNANLSDLINLLKPLGMNNKKAHYLKRIANDLIFKYDGKVPNERIKLESLSGVGRKSANLVLAILFNKPLIAVDTHVLRVSKRLKLVNPNDKPLIVEQKLNRLIIKDKRLDFHYQMVLFGRYYCKALKPRCKICKLKHQCGYYQLLAKKSSMHF